MDIEAWHDFHVITGGSAAALVGLMFVVISIGPQVGARSRENVRAFVSPTVTFFATVLVLSAIMTMPAITDDARGGAIAVIGCTGFVMMLRARVLPQLHTTDLGPEDTLFYFVLPLVVYLGVVASGVAIAYHGDAGSVLLGAMIIGMLVIALRNAWDLVVFIARRTAEQEESDQDRSRQTLESKRSSKPAERNSAR